VWEAPGASAQPLNVEGTSAAFTLQNFPSAENSSLKAEFQRGFRKGKPDTLVIGTSARLNPQKRLEDLLDALGLAHPRLPPYVLRVAGDKERGCEQYAAMLFDRAKGLPLEWLGSVSDIATFLSGLDLFVMISEPAGCPNASLEAMAAGLPVIATNVGGASEQVLDQITGRLVPPRDPVALADALVELAWDRKGRADFGQAGYRHASAHFSVERMVSDYRRLCGL
jgi:glycosyltransferase involved in cell wall biosynthesis